MRNAQISLEYLILFSAFLSMLLLFLPLISNVLQLGLLGLDSVRAKAFASEIKEGIAALSMQGEGARREIVAEPLHEWGISCANSKLEVVVRSAAGEKVVSESLALPLNFSADISEKTIFLIEKTSAGIRCRSLR